MNDLNTPPTVANDSHVAGYCALRLPVRDLKRSVAFYRDVVGYALNRPVGDNEACIEPAAGSGPGVFLMKATEDEFKHIHWRQWGAFYTSVELLVDDLGALHSRLVTAGAEIHSEPHIGRGGYFMMEFFDPDGHYVFAVDRRGRFFSLKPQLEELLGRELSGAESHGLQAACAVTGEHDEMSVLQAIVKELREQQINGSGCKGQ